MSGLHQANLSTTPIEIAGITGAHLLQYIERIERLEEEKTQLGEQVKEVFQEVKNSGFDVKILRIVLRERKRDQEDLDEEETMVLLYKQALGMMPSADN
ncbi:DUF2312 domain-containing protein [Candidatus Magnetaquicoccus inordinatus]|uniref:DUF2312 domain-containing protein n=1 Tax=Candidatus Magnetaquicoccus inordinatus TaxID=2496818 RepID=UPI00102B6C49|nr:GapR family DNA-binding domain-containing protein [Candidatus Magnetaquicoccus inordinatus]